MSESSKPVSEYSSFEMKSALCSMGGLDAFRARQKALFAGGMSAAKVRVEVTKEFTPRVEAWIAAGRPSARTLSIVPHVGASVAPEPERSEAREPPPPVPDASSETPSTPSEIQTREQYRQFMAREAPVIEQIAWVAKHLDVPEEFIQLDDVPCAEAWSMLLSYRSEARKKEFWDKVYVKLVPSRTQLNESEKVAVDGAYVIKACERIQAMRAKAVAATEVGAA